MKILKTGTQTARLQGRIRAHERPPSLKVDDNRSVLANASRSCKRAACVPVFLVFAFFLFSQNVPAQSKIVASLPDFDPKVNGFGFKNYRNGNRQWDDDLVVEDLISLFGVKSVCKVGVSAKDCVLKPSAAQWAKKYLGEMDIGHCEGMAVASLRFFDQLKYKRRVAPTDFQTGAKTPFALRLETMENYVAYYWLTQVFDEVAVPSLAMSAEGPVAIAKHLIAAMDSGDERFILGIRKTDKSGDKYGHAITPFAVEESFDQYKIHIYDNNFPGETRFLTINKAGNQKWSYNGATNPKSAPDYEGDRNTQSLELTANSWREGKCFRAAFTNDREQKIRCGANIARLVNPFPLTNASFRQTSRQNESDDAEFFLTGDGEMLITEPNGDRIGYDSKTNSYVNEIEDAVTDEIIGGLGVNAPHFTIPYEENADEPYEIEFSGKYLDQKENVIDFVFSAPGFTVGFSNIRLDQGETLRATISTDGEEISFTASADGETPEVFYAFDPEEGTGASYYTFIEGVELTAGKQIFYNFDFENGKLFFSDNDGNEDKYDIELTRVNPDGSEQTYTQSDLDIGKADRYEMDFGAWDGKEKMCFKDDEDGDSNFSEEQCTELEDDNTEEDFDN